MKKRRTKNMAGLDDVSRFDLVADLHAPWAEDFYKNSLERDAIIDRLQTELQEAGLTLRGKKPYVFDQPNAFRLKLRPDSVVFFIDNTAGPALVAVDPICNGMPITPEKGKLVHLRHFATLEGQPTSSARRGFLVFELQDEK